MGRVRQPGSVGNASKHWLVEAVLGVLLAAIISGAYLWGTRSESDSKEALAPARRTVYNSMPQPAPAIAPAPAPLATAPGTAPTVNSQSFAPRAPERGMEDAATVAPPPADAVADAVRLAPGASGDPVPGVRVYPGRNRGAFAQLGLHPGDVVMAVDGVPVTGEQLKELQSLVTGGGAATVTVFRAGREQQIALHRPD